MKKDKEDNIWKGMTFLVITYVVLFGGFVCVGVFNLAYSVSSDFYPSLFLGGLLTSLFGMLFGYCLLDLIQKVRILNRIKREEKTNGTNRT